MNAFPLEQSPHEITTPIPEGWRLHAWYCAALSVYFYPGEPLPEYRKHWLTQFKWVPLYAAGDTQVPVGWTLRSYFCPGENAFYASHRTISEKTLKQHPLVSLYAPPGSDGNEVAGHVPPQARAPAQTKTKSAH